MSASATLGKLVFATAVATLTQGCGTILCYNNSDRFEQFHGLVYGGVRYDYHLAFDERYLSERGSFLKPVFVIDMPLSLAVDTIALPVTASAEHRRSSRVEPRLFGIWRSDRERGLAEYHRVYDRYNLSEGQIFANTKDLGMRTITFTGHDVTIKPGTTERRYVYNVLSSTAKRTALRLKPVPTGEPEIYEIEFDAEGNWYTPQFPPSGEFFRREA
jgi:uncharacterized protein YceK